MPTPKKKRRRVIRLSVVGAAALTVAAVLAGCGSQTSPDSQQAAPSGSETIAKTLLEKTLYCLSADTKVKPGDGGQTLVLDGMSADEAVGEKIDPSKVTVAQEACVLHALQVPDAVVSHIDSTRALDGQQTDQWTSSDQTVKARWTYHPKSGLDLTLTTASA